MEMKIKQQIQNGWPFFWTDKELEIFGRSKNHLVTPTDRMADREISPVCSPPAITVPRIPWMTHQKWTWKTCKKRMIPVKIYVRSKSSNYALKKIFKKMVSKDRRTPDIFGCWILGWTYTAQLEFNTESLQQIGSSKEGCPIATMAWDQPPGIQAASRFDGRVLLSKYTT